MIRELTESYTPEKVLHRDNQIKDIKEVFETFKKFKMASNLLLQGFSGSGKTTAVNSVLKNQNGSFVYASGAQNKTSYKLLKSIFDLNFHTVERTLTEGIKKFKEDPKIIVIDEVNKLKDGVELRDLFDNLNTIYRETSCPVILITNQRGVIGLMPDDARLTLLFEKIEFKPYNAIELKDIISDRVELIKKVHPVNIPEGKLEYIAAVACRDMDGSARSALRITQKCILKNNFTDEEILKALSGIQAEDWRDFLTNLSQNQQKFLGLLLNLSSGQKKIPFSEILKHLSKYTPSRISQLLDVFEDYGIIKSEYVNRGRAGGNQRFIIFTSTQIYEKISEISEDLLAIY